MQATAINRDDKFKQGAADVNVSGAASTKENIPDIGFSLHEDRNVRKSSAR
jgi:hypothetical protein